MKKIVHSLLLSALLTVGLSQVTTACDLPDFNLYVTDSGEVWYNSSADIYGFQFDVDGATANGTSGGDAEAAGFSVSGSSTILGFSFSGAFIPAGCGTLVQLDLTNPAASLSNLIMSGPGGSALSFSYYDGDVAVGDTCEDQSACNFGQEGDCQYPQENFDCDGNCAVAVDCNGECGGSAVEDECGVCGGNGIDDGTCNCSGSLPEYLCEDGSYVCNEFDCSDVTNTDFQNPCDLPPNSLYMIADNDSGEIWYNSSSPIANISFNFDDTAVSYTHLTLPTILLV